MGIDRVTRYRLSCCQCGEVYPAEFTTADLDVMYSAIKGAGWVKAEYSVMEPNGRYWLQGFFCPKCAERPTVEDFRILTDRVWYTRKSDPDSGCPAPF